MCTNDNLGRFYNRLDLDVGIEMEGVVHPTIELVGC